MCDYTASGLSKTSRQFADSISSDEVRIWLNLLLENTLLVVVVGCIASYGLGWFLLAGYRLFLHPLSAFKGPRAAALSRNWIYKVFTTEHMPEPTFEKVHADYGLSVPNLSRRLLFCVRGACLTSAQESKR